MLAKIQALPDKVRQYLLVTMNYWAFTLTDGALRMLVVLHFHELGYDALQIAMLFLFYEFFGVVTNLVGGWLGARIGLNRTMQIGLVMQVIALLMLTLPSEYLFIPWVMAAQALSGIAKDLNKMSAKSSVKLLVSAEQQGRLYKWVAILTGSKNTLKGVGFFLGAVLLSTLGFQYAMLAMALFLLVMAIISAIYLQQDIGKASFKAKFKEIFSKSQAINRLSLARMCLFAARDVWFVVALPVYFASQSGWDDWSVGAFMACWVIAYGVVQGMAPKITGRSKRNAVQSATFWGWALTTLTLVLTLVFIFYASDTQPLTWILVAGLMLFGFTFAINSSLHSYLIVALAKSDGVSLDVGFYYMANAMGRLIGTLASGYMYLNYGLEACLAVATFLLVIASITVKLVPSPEAPSQEPPESSIHTSN
ncbi:organoarsenical effux MFS transporter ArsJ [Thalassotalea sp. PS06]|uniref:organoarsenical effux MFS transporter ArsJ n=1 Tax=Thalassotalea sp. PS06 TaxID=2594005 RepID=UPI001164ADE9|nr:organoarsenical effux MFS transporter ArsJ [Thalassotalea sp. PS06]QDP02252.1 organoarsenical effux MFS transporter ArsJ [Thalassotalea sp. PS06]